MLEIILELTKMYLEALRDPYMEEALENHIKAEKKGKDIKFMERNWFHKIARLIYKLIRLIYCSVIFYFVPFSVYFIATIVSTAEPPAQKKAGGGGH